MVHTFLPVQFLSYAKPVKQYVSIAIRIAFFVLLSLSGRAQNYTVTTTMDGTSASGTVNLRGAILAADAAGGSHTITVPAGTYNLTLGAIVFGNKAQNIIINGAGPNSTIINMAGTGNNQDRIFMINPPGTISNIQTSITGIKFTNGRLKSDTFGGGAIVAGGPTNTLTLTNCVFQNNMIDPTVAGSTGGGAIAFTFGGTLSIDQCTFTGNSVSTNANAGGAINFFAYSSSINNVYTYPNGTLSITNSTFSNNSVGTNGQGGAIIVAAQGYSASNPPIPTLSISITKNNFISNSAPGANGWGGAILATNSFSPTNTFAINYNRFVGNTSGSGNGSALFMTDTQGSVNAANNWWGCNGGPASCNDKAYRITGSSSGVLTTTPYLQLRTTAANNSACTGNGVGISAGFTTNSAGTVIAASNLSAFTGVSISFTPSLGSISNAQSTIQSNGLATATFTGNSAGNATVNAATDNVPSNDATARASIILNAGPTFSAQPATVATCVGGTASFSTTASGSGNLTFQWYKGATLLSNGNTGNGSTIAITSTATTSKLTFTNVGAGDAATNYSVKVTSGNSCTASSSNATLTVNSPPNATLVNNGPLSCSMTSVTLTASGGINYAFSGPGLNQNGATSTAVVSQTGTYLVVVTNASGCSATSQTSVTRLNQPLAGITQQPAASSVVCEGSAVTVSVSASGTVSTYQWYKDGAAITNVASATTATLTLPAVTTANSGSYSVVVTGACNSVTSAVFSLTVNASTGGMYTLKTGNWNDVSVWSCNRLPLSTDLLQIKHVITIPASYVANAKKISFDLNQRLIYGLGGKLTLTP
ncbi:hypothetical protein IC229_18565 [Spirosoma sp. BT702]|uniref:Ig-like domain-containing protein n=1 Tax=Spirosoma profusum TaxID=2771354 RepID=A0A927ARQ8_9BACT|nr:immunoglobulin domain-containing protein [Spirosoma profusum]MBD2702656.1 hypothetical protein [Spirosoma profusum]